MNNKSDFQCGRPLSVMIILLVSFSISVAPHVANDESPLFYGTYMHDGFIHTHVDFVEPHEEFIIQPMLVSSILLAHDFFILPDSPIFLLTPPPEAAFS